MSTECFPAILDIEVELNTHLELFQVLPQLVPCFFHGQGKPVAGFGGHQRDGRSKARAA